MRVLGELLEKKQPGHNIWQPAPLDINCGRADHFDQEKFFFFFFQISEAEAEPDLLSISEAEAEFEMLSRWNCQILR